LGGHHRDTSTAAEILPLYNAKVEEQAARSMRAYADKEAGRREAQEFRDQRLDRPGRYPAYLSVACLLNEPPPPDAMAVMIARANSFQGDEWNPKPTITGFRVLRRVTTYEPVE